MKIYDLLKKCNIDEVSDKLKAHYNPPENIEIYKTLIQKLQQIPQTENSPLNIFIKVFRLDNDGYFEDTVEIFDDEDTSLGFDVCATSENDDMIYSISNLSHRDFVNCTVDISATNNISYSNILAHCLWEITSYGFENY